MDLQAIAFYLLATITVASGLLVITARNPVHSVLFLILAFFTAAGLFVMLGAEFLAMLLVVVYVGAVAVLFLFVVMMLDVDFSQLREGFSRYLPIGMVVGGVLAIEMILVATTIANRGAASLNAAPANPDAALPNAEAAMAHARSAWPVRNLKPRRASSSQPAAAEPGACATR
jgi:NADH-quinone oxidoreductase subunit J